MPLLEKNLGAGNQTFSVKTDNVDFDLDSEKMIERLKHARKSPLFKNNGPSTQYTYCNPEYSETLQFEESDWLFQVLQNTDYSLYLPDDVTDRILALPREAVRHDLEHIIKYHIGLTCDGVTDEYDPDGYAGTLSNSIILLGKFGNEDDGEVLNQLSVITQGFDSDLEGLMLHSLLDIQAKELLPEIREMFATRFVDLGVCGDFAEVSQRILKPRYKDHYNHYFTEIHEHFADMKARWEC